MPRAHRYFLPNHIWHITHRCHQQEFLLKFGKDRQRWRHWLFQARKRYRLSVLNYIVTSNHIHLLVRDQGNGEITRSMQLIAGRTAQEYNQRKHRKGAYWEDRYHATAIDTNTYLARCMLYIDLNMVRAGAVSHPEDWRWSGYHEIQNPSQRYTIVDKEALLELFSVNTFQNFQQTRKAWVESALKSNAIKREVMWSKNLAVGHQHFVESIQSVLSINARHRTVVEEDGAYTLKEPSVSYDTLLEHEKGLLSDKNTILWE